ncbi:MULTISPECIES: DMT family transporter [unclassified Marinobacter]|uniref:DMT family transporter n=1 Tax=unclassified Marinobacter TaxID=83889 RepID=UPI0020100F66|nr:MULTISPECIES: DMT family transporter [unclassified Marinobacter]UQG55049.1 DMT family transporter [Marinobacter sp. M4C]UQG63850.1 DMT family transporter [Marinobacter sp. M2C]UQG68133.1 DMT family transporter [Marinobacter sp. M1C]
MRSAFQVYVVPAVFVWLWSTGFIGAKYGLPYAEPFTLLLYRMLFTLALLGVLALVLKVTWPSWRGAGHTAVTGLLVHGCYLGGVYYAIQGGMPSGITSLIVGLQPLVTALAAVVILRESITLRQWVGLSLGLLGVSLVLMEKLGGGPGIAGFPLWTLGWAMLSLLGISVGTVYQKRHGANVNLVAGTFIQYSAASVFFAIGAFALETREVVWDIQLQLSMAWLVFGVSIGAILLLMLLIRRGAASQVASLFYLVPPVTALQAFWLFDERLGVLAIAGGVVSITGVAFAVTGRKQPAHT